jgi:two-component system, NarL family, sensor histidine kinase DesK
MGSISGFGRCRKCPRSGFDRDCSHGRDLPAITWNANPPAVLSGLLMNRGERWGRYIALTALALMWPAAVAYMQGKIRGVAVPIFGTVAVAYCGIYIWYCISGFRLRGLALASAIVGSLTLLAAALDHISGQVSFNYFLIPLLVAGFSLPPRRAVIALGLVGAVTLAELILLVRLPLGEVVLEGVLVTPGVVLFGGSTMGLRYLLDTLSQLRAARAEIAQHAAGQERYRIARDLHDLLGHSLSLITLKGELATRLLPEGVKGGDEVRDIVGLSREALQQVREAVSGYRQPTLATELTAARVALQAAGIEVEVKQSLGALDRETEAVLGWVVREATTNVIRHSGGKHCRIELGRIDGQVVIEVVNDGWRVPQVPAGNGLRGLDERLALLGGTLEASALPGAGFRLGATISGQARPQPNAIDAEVPR